MSVRASQVFAVSMSTIVFTLSPATADAANPRLLSSVDLGAGFETSAAIAINDDGLVAGHGKRPSEQQVGFSWQQGVLDTFPAPGAQVRASAESGLVAGTSSPGTLRKLFCGLPVRSPTSAT
nr:hypothetical protein [Micromonospora sp. DSM 115978]